MPPPRWSAYRVPDLSGAAGVNVSRRRSLDQLDEPCTTGPVTSPSCSAAYCSIPIRMACENSPPIGAFGSTSVVPPAGPTDRTVVSPTGAKLSWHPAASIAIATANVVLCTLTHHPFSKGPTRWISADLARGSQLAVEPPAPPKQGPHDRQGTGDHDNPRRVAPGPIRIGHREAREGEAAHPLPPPRHAHDDQQDQRRQQVHGEIGQRSNEALALAERIEGEYAEE